MRYATSFNADVSTTNSPDNYIQIAINDALKTPSTNCIVQAEISRAYPECKLTVEVDFQWISRKYKVAQLEPPSKKSLLQQYEQTAANPQQAQAHYNPRLPGKLCGNTGSFVFNTKTHVPAQSANSSTIAKLQMKPEDSDMTSDSNKSVNTQSTRLIKLLKFNVW